MTTSSRLDLVIRDVREALGRVETANPHDRGTLAETKLRETLNALIDLRIGFAENGDGDA